MIRKPFPNFIIIAGSGKKVGKTCMATALIKPGIFIFITHFTEDLQAHKQTMLHLADLVLPAKSFSTPGIIERISFTEGIWHLTSR